MRYFLSTIFISLLFVNTSNAQLKLEYESVKFIDSGHIQVIAKIQNLGSTAFAFIPYGRARMTIDPNRDPKRIDAVAKYRSTGSEDYYKDLPSSFTIKTRFGTSLEAEMMQEIPSTGASSFFRWELIFPVPNDAVDVSVILFGEEKKLEDRASVLAEHEVEKVRARELIHRADSLFKNGDYSKAKTNYSIASRLDNSVSKSIAKNYYLTVKNLAEQELEDKNLQKSYEFLNQAMRIAKNGGVNSPKITNSLVDYYVKKGSAELNNSNYGNAYYYFGKALDYNQQNQVALNGKAKIESLKKNPKTATLLSVVPGGGQFYNGHGFGGLLYMGMGAYTLTYSIQNEKLAGGLIIYGGLAIWSMINASKHAKEFNNNLLSPNEDLQRFQVSVDPSRDSINLAFKINF